MEWWLELPLRLLPAHVREEHLRELRQLLADADWRAGRSGLGLWLSVLADALRAAPAAHADVVRQDLRQALRQVRRAPGFSLVAAVTLAVGIGGNAALFSLVDGVLLRPLPLGEPERLVEVTEENLEEQMLRFGISPANFVDYTDDRSVLQAAAAYWSVSGTVKIGDTPERVALLAVTGDFFRVITDQPFLGRVLRPEDDGPGATALVVSHAFWRNQLGGDEGVVGRTLELDGVVHRVVGVMPAGFEFLSPSIAIYKPLGMTPADRERRGARYLGAVARLAPGVTVAQANATVAARAEAVAGAHPETNRGWTARVSSLRDAVVGDVRPTLLLVWAAGGLVLLIAAGNVANLLLTRAAARERELALRTALGARIGRLLRQLLTEGLVLATVGGMLGLGLAQLLLARVREVAPTGVPRLDDVVLGGRTALFTAGLVVVTTILFSVLPVWSVRRPSRDALLGSGRVGVGRSRSRWRATLVVGEVALATFVLVAGGLVVRTVTRLLDAPLGFVPDGALVFRIEPPFRLPSDAEGDFLAAFLAERARAAAGYQVLEERLGALPGVRAVGSVNRVPLSGGFWITNVDVASRPVASVDERPAPFIRVVTPGYFAAIGTRLLRGRLIEPADVDGAERVAVIDETMARQLWSGDDPLGDELLLDSPPEMELRARVVGIVESIRMGRLDTEARPAFYLPMAQSIEGFGNNWGMDVVLTPATAGAALPAIREAARAAFPDAAVFQARSMEEIVARSLADRRFQLLVLGLFGVSALVLATVGVGALLGLVVRQQRRELGVRLALGARPASLWWLVQRRGLLLVGLGSILGVVSALGFGGTLASLVYGVSVRDPMALLGGPALLIAAALLAASLPAARAMRVDPAWILRED
ncbi:MAG: ABC transporter permease [Gemmatimonadales bacterium]